MQLLICIVGGSGSGKSHLENELCEIDGYKKAISHTTRLKRDGEVNGREYHFMSDEEFASLELLESVTFSGNKYGLSVSEFNKTENHLVFVVEPNGLNQIKKHIKDNDLPIVPITIYMDIKYKDRFKNMVKRGDNPIDIQERLANETIVEDFIEFGNKPEIVVKNLNEKTSKVVKEDIDEIIKILEK